ncbi:helix-turn-helix domain-containing protein [Kibdelosporangium lantanae]|uniref:Helix-turn-helix domain-containing protein n=1 Tax=Kibdelosporangium lantanae TaxID=1497396 RepID=A0ABW3M0Z1_9PSEU
MSAYTQEARARFQVLVSELAGEKGLQLADVAKRAGISEATLRRVRHKYDASITTATLRGLERAYDLADRELDRFLTTPGYRPQPRTKPLAPETSTSDQVARFLRRFIAAQPDEARKVRAQFRTI